MESFNEIDEILSKIRIQAKAIYDEDPTQGKQIADRIHAILLSVGAVFYDPAMLPDLHSVLNAFSQRHLKALQEQKGDSAKAWN